MDFDEITRILEMMREHELSEFELERDNAKLRIKKQGGGHQVAGGRVPEDAVRERAARVDSDPAHDYEPRGRVPKAGTTGRAERIGSF